MGGFSALLLFSLLLGGCSEKAPVKANPIAEASAFIQGGDLYARTALDPKYSKLVFSALRHGEPMQATYRFSFFRHHPYLPDYPLAKVSIKKRLRLRLVTKRYEMHDIKTGEIHYTPDKEIAVRFFSNPRFVLLGKEAQLRPNHRYRLRVEFELDHQGMSPMFRTLKRWLNLDQNTDYQFEVDFNPA